MKSYNVVFVVLTYKNADDLQEYIESVKKYYTEYKILIVNSYFDDITKNNIEKIANKNNCDFINVENKGYGYGNNKGIEYCNQNYIYNFIIVSNPDIIIKKNDFFLDEFIGKNVVIAPKIITLKGKQQNPYWVINNVFAEYLIYVGYKRKNRMILYSGIAINKIIRIIFNIYTKIIDRKTYTIYAAHGSFVIISKKVFDSLDILYDEKMFLFAEEALLAHNLRKRDIKTLYTNKIEILHKEDGSISVSKINEKDELRKSVIYYYENYILKH